MILFLFALLLCLLHHTTASYTNIVPRRQVVRTGKTPSAPNWPVLPFDSDVAQSVHNNDIITQLHPSTPSH